MIRFVFWNIGKNGVGIIDEIKKLGDFEVLILAENAEVPSENICSEFDLIKTEDKLENNKEKWIQVYQRKGLKITIDHISQEYDEEVDEIEYQLSHDTKVIQTIRRKVNRFQLYKISGEIEDTFFAFIHFPSKLHQDEISQWQIVEPYKRAIHNLTNNNRVIIVGDFNMNPFDLGMIEPRGFYAQNNISTTKIDAHFAHGISEFMYYNPCWTLLGDFYLNHENKAIMRQGGSHYFNKQLARNIKWHLLDQIIFRKSLYDEFLKEELKIIETVEWIDQLTASFEKKKKKRENGEVVLDHLPLQFAFDFKTK